MQDIGTNIWNSWGIEVDCTTGNFGIQNDGDGFQLLRIDEKSTNDAVRTI